MKTTEQQNSQSARRYGVWCEVTGGVTGSRAAWAKSGEKVISWDNREDAEQYAKQRRAETAGNTRAYFIFTAKEFTNP